MTNPFEARTPTEKSVGAIKAMRDNFKVIYDVLLSIPEARERALAITKLEEAAMWANKAIVATQEAQQ